MSVKSKDEEVVPQPGSGWLPRGGGNTGQGESTAVRAGGDTAHGVWRLGEGFVNHYSLINVCF